MKRIVMLMTLGTVGCATSNGRPEFKESTVIERIGEKRDTPVWTHAEKVMFEEDGNVVFVSEISMSGNARSGACLKSAELDGKSSMLNYIKSNVTSSGQLNETDAVSDPGYEALTAFLSQGKLSGVKVQDRYWEKREESDESGFRVLRLRCSVKLSVKKSVLERQLREAVTNAPAGNPEIRAKLLEAQKDFIENVSAESSNKE